MKQVEISANKLFTSFIAIIQAHVYKDTTRERVYEDVVELFDDTFSLERDDWTGVEPLDPLLPGVLDRYYDNDIFFDPDIDFGDEDDAGKD